MKSCEFCTMPGKDRGDDVHICDACWKILKDPVTALPLIRGHITMQLRGKVPEDELKKQVNAFMEMVSKWKRPG